MSGAPLHFKGLLPLHPEMTDPSKANYKEPAKSGARKQYKDQQARGAI